MKKTILLFAMIFIITSAGCSKAPANKNENDAANPEATVSKVGEESLSALQEKITADEKLLGVAYLGFVDYDTTLKLDEFKKQEHIKGIPFIESISECTENEGYRVYAIVPADRQTTITVFKCEFDSDYMPCAGEKIIESNEPILVRGNVSDTIPNLYIIAQKDDFKVEYTPAQSGMDGKLENSDNKIYDFTPYDKMAEFNLADKLPDAVFCGDWTTIESVAGEERVLYFTFDPTGNVSYSYGIGNSEIIEMFEGTWELDGYLLKLSMIGGLIDSVDNSVIPEPYDCNPSFEWEVNAEGLELTHIDGDEILYGTKGKTFEFYEN